MTDPIDSTPGPNRSRQGPVWSPCSHDRPDLRRRPGERGAGLAEYGLLLLLIVLVVIVAVTDLGPAIVTMLDAATGGL